MFKTNLLFFLKIKFRYHWGYTVFKGGPSKSRISYLLPPPTTIIGALAYGLRRTMKLPEEENGFSGAESLRRATVSVNIRVNGALSEFMDVSKIWWFRERERKMKFDAVALGKVYAPSAIGEAIIIFDKASLKEVFGEEFIKKIVLSAHSISRVGSRESIVNVENVSYGEPGVYKASGKVETKHSFWRECAKKIVGDRIESKVIDFRVTPIGNYLKPKWGVMVYPYSSAKKKPTILEVVPSENTLVLNVGGDIVLVR